MSEPMVNVNLAKCDCGGTTPDGRHAPDCPGIQRFIPCPIPRSFECTVRLGECQCFEKGNRPTHGGHWSDCPNYSPIRVVCSISVETWAESEVTDPDYPEARDRNPDAEARAQAVLRILRMRWGVVKMVVTGQHVGLDDATAGMSPNLFAQRDAVYAALCEMALAEDDAHDALRRYLGAGMPESLQVRVGHKTPLRTSTFALAEYVERLIDLVGTIA